MIPIMKSSKKINLIALYIFAFWGAPIKFSLTLLLVILKMNSNEDKKVEVRFVVY